MSIGIDMLARGWLVLELTNDPFWVGLIAGLGGLAQVGFGLFGGVLVDRLNKRRVLLWVQALSGLVAIAIGLVIFFDTLTLWHLALSAVLQGMLMAARLPAGNSMIYTMVGRKVILNALASQLLAFNLSRIFGSLLAGTAIDDFGVGYAYVFMAASSWFSAFMILFVNGDYRSEGRGETFWQSAKVGLSYAYENRPIRVLLLMSVLMELFGFSFNVMLPVMARDVLGVGATGLGYLSAAAAFGATVSTITVAGLGDFREKANLLIFTALAAGISISLFAFSPWFLLSLVFSAMVGAALMSYDAIMGALLQLLSTDEIRGRVLGLYGLTFGFTPLGGFIVGTIASLFSAPLAVGLGGLVIVTYIVSVQGFIKRTVQKAVP
ncbi:MAG: MFS family permease/MFS family permease [Chloroflexi bacterium]|jgi:MFS family permease|nr:MAG: MFS family permease/MFS family permease [Chloroflexota bacterium]